MAHFGSVVAVHLALALALSGKPDEAAAVLDEADERSEPSNLFGVERVVARAWTAAARHELPAARAIFEEGVTLGQSIGDHVGAALALHGLARIGHASESLERLTAIASSSDSPFLDAQATHARALDRSDPDTLLEVASSFDAMGASLLAAEAASDAAVARKKRGDPRGAAAAERQAAAYASKCQVVATPSLRPVEPRATLTKAERETALLAAAGYTNREIAERQYLSIRTVQNRLQHIYVKLGVAGRDELKSVLG
jgi:DNA-binding CsgD family transcriptional regulator